MEVTNGEAPRDYPPTRPSKSTTGSHSTQEIRQQRPTVAIDGHVDGELNSRLRNLVVRENSLRPSICEVTFDNDATGPAAPQMGAIYRDRQYMHFGRGLSIRLGSGRARTTIFEGRIQELIGHYPRSAPHQITAIAADAMQELRTTKRSRTFEDVTDADVCALIAADHALSSSANISGPTHRTLTQVHQTDLDFLRSRALAIDAALWVEGRTLRMEARGRHQRGSFALTYGQGLLEFVASANLAGQVSSVWVSGWDPANKRAILGIADQQSVGSEVADGIGGNELLEGDFTRRREHYDNLGPASEEEARELATSRYRQAARRFVIGRGLALGNGRMHVGTRVELTGLGDTFSGDYYLTGVTHRFEDDAGFLTEFTAERPAIGRDHSG